MKLFTKIFLNLKILSYALEVVLLLHLPFIFLSNVLFIHISPLVIFPLVETYFRTLPMVPTTFSFLFLIFFWVKYVFDPLIFIKN